MKNFIQPGDTVTVPAPYDVTSGAGCLVGSLFGIAAFTAKAGADLEIKRTGVFSLNKKAADALAQGAKAYWDDAEKEITATDAGNVLIGATAVAAAGPDSDVVVVLDGAVR